MVRSLSPAIQNILHVVPARPFGGLQRVAALLAAEQRVHGLNAQVVALYPQTHFQELLSNDNVPYTVIPGTRPSLSGLREFRKILIQDWSLVHIHGGLLWSNAMALFSKRTPVVYHAHSYPTLDRSMKFRILKTVNRSLVDLVVAVSRDVADAWRQTGIGAETEVVYNSIRLPSEVRPKSVIPSGKPIVFGMTTRLAKDKGVLEFIEVATALYEKRRDVRFIVAGDGPAKETFAGEIRKRGLDNVFSWPGHLADLDAFWATVDIALFTAPKEPFGLRILEAMARRVPVAAYLTGGGSDEIFQPGGTALTAPYRDSNALASRALELCDDPALRERIQQAAYDDVANRFTVAAMHEGVMHAYARALK